MSSRGFKFNNNTKCKSVIRRCEKNNKAIHLLYKLNKHMGTHHSYLKKAILDAYSKEYISEWQLKKYNNIYKLGIKAQHHY